MTPTIKKIKKEHREAFAAIGRMGGKATAKKYGKDYMRKLSKKGVAARRNTEPALS